MAKLPSHPLIAIAMLALAACSQSEKDENAAQSSASPQAANHADPVASAMAAAPAAVSSKAAIVSMSVDGSMATLREGSNGWTCMPDNPATPGPDPMCFDANAGEWVMAWVGHKPPPIEKPGVMYMLSGGTDASNVDPYATKPSEGDDWLHTGPHLMLVGSAAALNGYPSGAKPDTKAPYVMWSGTPYAHLMIPAS